METGYVLYNPLAANGRGEEDAKLLEMLLPEAPRFFDMTRITNYSAFLGGMDKDDYLVIVGGDGTLNRFANDTSGMEIPQEILYFPAGIRNDFARDMGKEVLSSPFSVARYLKDLPWVEVKGKKYRFLNGVGLGVDAYSCQADREHKTAADKKGNFAWTAMKNILFHFAPRNARITVDGQEYRYKNVWMASTRRGRFCGEGMLTLTVLCGSRFRAAGVLPGVFQGEHRKHSNVVVEHTGYEITVEFDVSTPLRMDGEIFADVMGYTARSEERRIRKDKERAAV